MPAKAPRGTGVDGGAREFALRERQNPKSKDWPKLISETLVTSAFGDKYALIPNSVSQMITRPNTRPWSPQVEGCSMFLDLKLGVLQVVDMGPLSLENFLMDPKGGSGSLWGHCQHKPSYKLFMIFRHLSPVILFKFPCCQAQSWRLCLGGYEIGK